MAYSKNGCTRKPSLDGKLRKSILIVFSLQPLCLRMQQMKPYPRPHTHTHTHTHKHSHLSFFSVRTLPALSPLVLPLPDQYHRSGSYQAAKWPHHHKHTHTHTHTHCHRILPENEWMAIINTGWLVRPRLAAPNHQRQQRCGLCVGCIDLVMAASYAVGQC